MGTELPHPRLKRLRQQPIVGIQEHQVFPPGVTDPCVARPGEPLVLLANAAHPGIAGGYLRGVVGRSIVYYKDLKVRITLGEDALYRFAEEVGLVVAGNHHRDQRRARALFSSEVVGITSNAFVVLRSAVVLCHLLSTLTRMWSSFLISLWVLESLRLRMRMSCSCWRSRMFCCCWRSRMFCRCWRS